LLTIQEGLSSEEEAATESRRFVNNIEARNVYYNRRMCRRTKQNRGHFMTSISGTIIALVFVFFTLISLLSVNPRWDNEFPVLTDGQNKVSDLGLRFAFQK